MTKEELSKQEPEMSCEAFGNIEQLLFELGDDLPDSVDYVTKIQNEMKKVVSINKRLRKWGRDWQKYATEEIKKNK